MSGRKGINASNRRESGAFVPFPVSVLNHPNFIRLSNKAVKLLMDLVTQIRFKVGGPVNNGDISVAWKLMGKRGWKSKETLRNALDELVYFRFVKLTRQGGRHQPSLYAVTWWAIDECGGKLDVSPTKVPSNEWKEKKDPWMAPRRKTETVPRSSDERAPAIGSMTALPGRKIDEKAAAAPTLGSIHSFRCPDNRTPS